MNRSLIRKIFKIIGLTLLTISGILVFLLYTFTSPVSETEIIEKFEDDVDQPVISYELFKDRHVRVVGMQKEIDSLLPTLFLFMALQAPPWILNVI
jgi:hypothetical protein